MVCPERVKIDFFLDTIWHTVSFTGSGIGERNQHLSEQLIVQELKLSKTIVHEIETE